MRARRTTVGLVVIALVAAVSASQALAGNSKGVAGSTGQYTTIVTGSSSPGATETVDGVPATQAPGVFQQGTSVAATQPGGAAAIITPFAPTGCRTAAVNWKAGLDAFGVTMWKIWNHTHWCVSSWDVSSVSGWTDVYTAPIWTSSNQSWHHAVWGPSTDITTAHADFCLSAYFGCLQSASPNVQTWVNGAGNYSFDDSHWYAGS
ncbi:MAG: hypothetical protein ACRDLM_02190 [Gaiellaceae bacterium]